MSDKLVRDELLRSHRFQRLSGDTPKLLFLVLLLSSDSLSNAEYNTTAISVAMGRTITDEAAETLLAELLERDLVRPYEFEGKQYVHIPRSRQRIRYISSKHPRPPPSLEDNNIKSLLEKVRPKSDTSLTQDGRREEKRREVKQGDQPVDKSVHKWWSTLNSMKEKAYSLGLKDNPGESRDAFYQRIRTALDAQHQNK